jgi:HEPN domain-containing protein
LIEEKVGERLKTHYLKELVREFSKVYKEKEI